MANAIYTMVKNENILLPLWLKYYSKYFKNIHVLNHNSTDGSVEKAHRDFDFTEHKIVNDAVYNSNQMRKMGINGQRMLFDDYGYDVVVFAECDEFILVDPEKYSGLSEFILQMEEDYVYCTGREVLQLDKEAAIDWDRPILAQRSIWWPHPSYHKPVISKVPSDWVIGFHYLRSEQGRAEKSPLELGEYIKSIACPDVYMVHLQKVDWELFSSRGRFKGDKSQFQIGINEKEEIPEKWKGLL